MIARYFLWSLSAAWMMGIGLRFIIDGFFNKQLYHVNVFDVFFDWGILFFLGVLLFIVMIYDCRKKYMEEKKNVV